MASVPTQEEILAATRKSQEAMIAAIKNWFETVRTANSRLTSVYAPLTERLPKLPPVSLPFADKLPTPGEAVGSAYDMAEQLLANQRKFSEDLLKAMTPLMPGRSVTTPKGDGSSEPKIPGHQVWREAVAASEPKPVAVSEPKPVAVREPKPVAVSEPKPVAVREPKPAGTSEPKPTAASAEPKAPVRSAAKSTPARPAPRTAAAKSPAAKSPAAGSTAAKSAPKSTPASRAPKDTDAS
jgi:outer membrane biosynthesis protein TonB